MSGGLSIASGFAQGAQARAQAEAEAGYLEAQANQAEVAARRDRQDAEAERAQFLARSRAIMAAGGAATDTGTALALQSAAAGRFGGSIYRIGADADVLAEGYRVRAGNVRRAGDFSNTMSIIGGIGNSLQPFYQGYSILSSSGPRAGM